MAERSKKYPHAFFERGSWYHRTKTLQEDYSVKYGKAGGFQTAEDAEKSYREQMEEFDRLMKARFISQGADVTLKDYLVYWFQSLFSERVESTTRYVAAYVLYTFILPNLDGTLKLALTSTEYLNGLLKMTERYCPSAANKSRELLLIAFKDAAAARLVSGNPAVGTKKYPRKRAKIRILNKEQLKVFLAAAKKRNWFLEILLGLYLGLRKGEILGLKFSDFDVEKGTVHIQRQLAADYKLGENSAAIEEYKIVERDPKTANSNRILRVPSILLVELEKRKEKISHNKQMLEEAYHDGGYVSCQKNGEVHGLNSMNKEISLLCEKNMLPHISVHSLRHMFATILLERGVSIAKISGMLGHSSVHTTFEFYLEVMDADVKLMEFMNREFTLEEVDTDAAKG